MGAGIVPFPRLTLDQYTSLRAVLAVGRSPRAPTLLRYHVLSEASLGALVTHWEQELAKEPEQRAAFEDALATFTDWVRAQPA
jgi:hypothetical protein